MHVRATGEFSYDSCKLEQIMLQKYNLVDLTELIPQQC